MEQNTSSSQMSVCGSPGSRSSAHSVSLWLLDYCWIITQIHPMNMARQASETAGASSESSMFLKSSPQGRKAYMCHQREKQQGSHRKGRCCGHAVSILDQLCHCNKQLISQARILHQMLSKISVFS